MLELVVAIVVMGIAVMTLPLILERVQANNAFAMQQEAILAAKTKIGDVITFPWDKNSIQGSLFRVLDTNSVNYRRVANTTRRIGHVNQKKRRKLFNVETNASTINNATVANRDGIEDFNAETVSLNILNAANAEFAGTLDYRFDLNMTTTVRYIPDTPNTPFTFVSNGVTNPTTNIKMIEVTLQGQDLSTFRLRAYSANIGQSQPLRRDYQ